MTVVAFLQNGWFKDPEKWRARLNGPDRLTYIAMPLFMGCLTGRRLKTAFGEDLCNEIVWEEASREISGNPKAAPPADHMHMYQVIVEQKPTIVLTFGKIALAGFGQVRLLKDPLPDVFHIHGPHPAARHRECPDQLRVMAENFRTTVAQNAEYHRESH